MKKILIIDDNEGMLFVMRQALEIKGYTVETWETFKGIDAVAQSDPKMVYLDVSLRGRDGREISRELKNNPKTKHIPVVILTAHPDVDVLTQEAQADASLPKPFELEHLWHISKKYTE